MNPIETMSDDAKDHPLRTRRDKLQESNGIGVNNQPPSQPTTQNEHLREVPDDEPIHPFLPVAIDLSFVLSAQSLQMSIYSWLT